VAVVFVLGWVGSFFALFVGVVLCGFLLPFLFWCLGWFVVVFLVFLFFFCVVLGWFFLWVVWFFCLLNYPV